MNAQIGNTVVYLSLYKAIVLVRYDQFPRFLWLTLQPEPTHQHHHVLAIQCQTKDSTQRRFLAARQCLRHSLVLQPQQEQGMTQLLHHHKTTVRHRHRLAHQLRRKQVTMMKISRFLPKSETTDLRAL